MFFFLFFFTHFKNSHLAGSGNTDSTLWRSGLSSARPAEERTLAPASVRTRRTGVFFFPFLFFNAVFKNIHFQTESTQLVTILSFSVPVPPSVGSLPFPTSLPHPQLPNGYVIHHAPSASLFPSPPLSGSLVWLSLYTGGTNGDQSD